MYKFIVSDLDETLLNDEHQVCQANIDAIHKADSLGVKFIPATGRGYESIENTLKTLDLYGKENEYVLSLNGCSIIHNFDKSSLLFDGLDFETTHKLFQFGLTKNVCIHIYTQDKVYVYNFNDNERDRFHAQGVSYIELSEPSIDFLKAQPIAKILYENLDTNYLKSFEKDLKSITDGKVTVSYSSNRYMEFNKIGVNKGNSMLKLAEILGVKQEEIIAVGDNYNDLSMLSKAGLSVAAGNAVDAVKQQCDYVCKNTHNDGVIAEIMEKFFN